jgi:hypothetical protein
MARQTNRERILQILQESDKALCDDCLSDLSGVRPRQQVYQICMRLASEGVLTRTDDRCFGPRGENNKLVSRVGQTIPKKSVLLDQAPNRDRQILVLVAAHTKMNRALDGLDDAPVAREPFAQKLSRLKGRGAVALNIAEMMFMINRFRNRVVKEGERLDIEEWGVFQSGIALVAKKLSFPLDKS